MRRLAGHRGVRTAMLGLVIPLLLLALWELSGQLGWVRSNLLPPPSAVLANASTWAGAANCGPISR